MSQVIESDAGFDLDLGQVAEFARVSKRTICRAIAAGELDVISYNRRVLRVPYAAFADWRHRNVIGAEATHATPPPMRSRCRIDAAIDYEPEHIASFAGVSPRTILELVSQGKLPAVRYGERAALRISGREFLAFRERCRKPAVMSSTRCSSPQLRLHSDVRVA